MKRKILSLLISILFLGCQEGVKKESSMNVYKVGVQELSETESSLGLKKVDLNDSQNSSFQYSSFIPKSESDRKRVEYIKSNLEKYIQSADKLINLADEKVVLFPEKNSILKKRENASILLGRIYAVEDYSKSSPVIENWTVAYSEFDTRYKKFHLSMTQIIQMGFDKECFENNDKFNQQKRKLSKLQLQVARNESYKMFQESTRIRQLMVKYDYFDNKNLKFLETLIDLSAFFFNSFSQ